MQITNIEVIELKVPFIDGGKGEGLFPQKFNALDFVLIKVETDTGLIGWGEAFSFSIATPVATLLRQSVVPLLIGSDPTDPDAISENLQHKLHIIGRYGITQFALSGVEIALWDIAAKAEGVSLAERLGGRQRERVAAYASLVRYADTPLIEKTLSRAVDEGFRCIKLHEIELRYVQEARHVLGPDVPLVNDVNCNWSVEQTLAMADELIELDLLWLEEPIFPPEDFRALSKLRQRGLAIACGENACTSQQFQHMLDENAVDYIQPSVTKAGGVTQCMRARQLAQVNGIATAQHSPYFGPGYLATLQMLAASHADEWFEVLYIDRDGDLFTDFPLPVDGWVQIPDGPGLGMDPDPVAISKYRVN